MTPWKYAPSAPTHSAPAMCIIFQQMPVSLNIFICIHVSISKGMEVNRVPQGAGMSQCFCAAATVGVEQKDQDRLSGSLCY